MPFSITTLGLRKVSIMTFNIKAFSITTWNIAETGISTLSITSSSILSKMTQHDDTQHKIKISYAECLIMLSIVILSVSV